MRFKNPARSPRKGDIITAIIKYFVLRVDDFRVETEKLFHTGEGPSGQIEVEFSGNERVK